MAVTVFRNVAPCLLKGHRRVWAIYCIYYQVRKVILRCEINSLLISENIRKQTNKSKVSEGIYTVSTAKLMNRHGLTVRRPEPLATQLREFQIYQYMKLYLIFFSGSSFIKWRIKRNNPKYYKENTSTFSRWIKKLLGITSLLDSTAIDSL